MLIDVRDGPGACKCIRLSGYLDAAGAAAIVLRWQAAVVDASRDSLVDFSDVGGAEILALNLLADAVHAARLRGSRVVCFGVDDSLLQQLLGSRWQGEVLLARNQAEALARLGAS
jgi:anti-anti-sigma regulatory factor